MLAILNPLRITVHPQVFREIPIIPTTSKRIPQHALITKRDETTPMKKSTSHWVKL